VAAAAAESRWGRERAGKRAGRVGFARAGVRLGCVRWFGSAIREERVPAMRSQSLATIAFPGFMRAPMIALRTHACGSIIKLTSAKYVQTNINR
jgi:hypothetical protein